MGTGRLSHPTPLTLTTACGSDGQHNEAGYGESSLQCRSCHDDWKHHCLKLRPVNWFWLYDAASAYEAASGGDIGGRRDTPEFGVGVQLISVYQKFPIVMRICAHGISWCFNGIFTHVWGLYCQTRSDAGPGYSSVLLLRTPKFAMDRHYFLSYEYGAGMLFTTHSHEVGLTKIPPCIETLWKAWCHWLLQCAASHRRRCQVTGLYSMFCQQGS